MQGRASSTSLPLFDCVRRKAIWLIVNLYLTCNPQSLAHCWAVASLHVFHRYCLEFCPSEPALSVLIPLAFERLYRSHTSSHPHQVSMHKFCILLRSCKVAEHHSLFIFLSTCNLSLSKNRVNKLVLTWMYPTIPFCSVIWLCILSLMVWITVIKNWLRGKQFPFIETTSTTTSFWPTEIRS